ncbi:MAG TPA: hypothetical protein VF144_04985 [Chitinophagaceae bacterium]
MNRNYKPLTTPGTEKNFSNPALWIILIIYIIGAGSGILHHELWGDEIHSWNIAKGSDSISDLIINTRYEGHPPLWYTILWVISKFTHDTFSFQVVHFLIACGVVFLILFYSPFPIATKILLPFGYFFLFEYAVISRNYSIGILVAFCLCVIMHRNFKGKLLLYYSLLFLLCNTHILSILLACSLHLYFLMLNFEQNKKTNWLALHVVVGMIISLPAIYFVFPPSDSGLNIEFWANKWSLDHVKVIVQAPVRSFIPIPQWSEYHFWDTNLLIGTITNWLIPVISATLILSAIIVLKKNRKCLYLFLLNLLLILVLSLIIPFTNARHVGFIFIGFMVALWFFCNRQKLHYGERIIILSLLVFQVIGAAVATIKDGRYPFSNGRQVIDLLNKIPPQEKVVTDYWCLNNLVAFSNKPYYCIELGREASFLLWNDELKSALNRTDRYSNGISAFLRMESLKKVHMVSIQGPARLSQLDSKLETFFNVKLLDKTAGAIEKGSDLYLYEITPK